MTWVVKRCIREFGEVMKIVDSEHDTEEAAEQAAIDAERSGLCDFAVVEEE